MSNAPPTCRPRRAFTLVELLVCIAIISVLAAILLPAVERARRSATAMHCLSNQRQLVLMSHLYASDNDGHLVLSRHYDADGRQKLWTHALAPYGGGHADVALCPARGPAEVEAVYSEDWSGRDLLNIGINRNLEALEGRESKWLPPSSGSWRIWTFHSPSDTWYFADSFCGLRGFHCRLGWQVDGQSSFSTRHDGHVQLAFLDGHVEAVPAEKLTDATGITVADNEAGVWWFPRPAQPEWIVP